MTASWSSFPLHQGSHECRPASQLSAALGRAAQQGHATDVNERQAIKVECQLRAVVHGSVCHSLQLVHPGIRRAALRASEPFVRLRPLRVVTLNTRVLVGQASWPNSQQSHWQLECQRVSRMRRRQAELASASSISGVMAAVRARRISRAGGYEIKWGRGHDIWDRYDIS